LYVKLGLPWKHQDPLLKRAPKRYQDPVFWVWHGFFSPLRDTKILLCGCGMNFFSPLRGTSSKTTHYPLSYVLFSAQYPNSYRKSSLLWTTPKGTKTAFLTPTRYDERPRPFIWEFPRDLTSQSYRRPSRALRNRPVSYSRYWTETSLQLRLTQVVVSNASYIILFLMILHRKSLHCKLVPVQYREYENCTIFHVF